MNEIVGRIEFSKDNSGIDWTITFDQFLERLAERKEATLKPLIERCEGTFDAAHDFNGQSIWQLYSLIDTYRKALREACENDPNDFAFYVRRGRGYK